MKLNATSKKTAEGRNIRLKRKTFPFLVGNANELIAPKGKKSQNSNFNPRENIFYPLQRHFFHTK